MFDFKGELNEYQGIFIAERFLWELADSVGGENELLEGGFSRTNTEIRVNHILV